MNSVEAINLVAIYAAPLPFDVRLHSEGICSSPAGGLIGGVQGFGVMFSIAQGTRRGMRASTRRIRS
jgi:hypothetical protein